MTTLKTNRYSIQNGEVSTKSDIGNENGRVRSLYFDYTFLAEAGSSDVIKLCKLPAGARMTNVHVYFPDLGTVGAANLGWAASADAVEGAQASGIGASLDFHTAANDFKMAGSALGFQKRFLSQVDVQLAFSAATDVATGLKFLGSIEYVID